MPHTNRCCCCRRGLARVRHEDSIFETYGFSHLQFVGSRSACWSYAPQMATEIIGYDPATRRLIAWNNEGIVALSIEVCGDSNDIPSTVLLDGATERDIRESTYPGPGIAHPNGAPHSQWIHANEQRVWGQTLWKVEDGLHLADWHRTWSVLHDGSDLQIHTDRGGVWDHFAPRYAAVGPTGNVLTVWIAADYEDGCARTDPYEYCVGETIVFRGYINLGPGSCGPLPAPPNSIIGGYLFGLTSGDNGSLLDFDGGHLVNSHGAPDLGESSSGLWVSGGGNYGHVTYHYQVGSEIYFSRMRAFAVDPVSGEAYIVWGRQDNSSPEPEINVSILPQMISPGELTEKPDVRWCRVGGGSAYGRPGYLAAGKHPAHHVPFLLETCGRRRCETDVTPNPLPCASQAELIVRDGGNSFPSCLNWSWLLTFPQRCNCIAQFIGVNDEGLFCFRITCSDGSTAEVCVDPAICEPLSCCACVENAQGILANYELLPDCTFVYTNVAYGEVTAYAIWGTALNYNIFACTELFFGGVCAKQYDCPIGTLADCDDRGLLIQTDVQNEGLPNESRWEHYIYNVRATVSCLGGEDDEAQFVLQFQTQVFKVLDEGTPVCELANTGHDLGASRFTNASPGRTCFGGVGYQESVITGPCAPYTLAIRWHLNHPVE